MPEILPAPLAYNQLPFVSICFILLLFLAFALPMLPLIIDDPGV
jgi:hypothetical protein